MKIRTQTSDPISVDDCTTIAALFEQRCDTLGDRVAHREKELGIWHAYSWNDYFNHAEWIGMGLRELGMQRGDVVSILSEDRREWLYCDMGIMGIGGIANGVYTTDSAAQLSYLINDSGSRFLLMFYDELLEIGKRAAHEQTTFFREQIKLAQADDTLMLIYTSGTTGAPKGAMISHRNMIFQLAAGIDMLEAYPEDEQLCFLPLCHVYERLLSVHVQLGVGLTVNFTESVETVFENLQEVSPHTFASVPRVWEKIYSRVQIMRSEATALGRWSLDRAIAAGTKRAQLVEDDRPVPGSLELRYRVWDFLVLRNLRRMLGMDRMRRAGSGAAPVSPELLRWFFAIGVPLLEGYGATETSGVTTVNTSDDNTIGSVGKPMAGVELKIADDGEILVRGANVFQGYWNMPDKTAETIRDGWLHTGDVGRIGNNGALTITGRIKDIIITAGGKNVTPAEIESKLKFSPYISDAVVIGDQRKFLSCLVMIDQENVEKFAQDNAIPFADFASLCAAEPVRELIGSEINTVNRDFARVEQIKDFRLIDMLLTAEDDELTPTMKLKRSFVETKHKPLIDSMYAG